MDESVDDITAAVTAARPMAPTSGLADGARHDLVAYLEALPFGVVDADVPLPGPEAQVFAEVGVDPQAFRDDLAQRQLAWRLLNVP